MDFLEMLQANGGLLQEREFTGDERKAAAKSGAALPDGSFPVETPEDLQNAIQAYGRSKNPAEAKAHIIKRAHALGEEKSLPDSWHDAKDCPACAKESAPERRIVANVQQLDESATYAPSTGNLTITVIKPGVSKNNRYYSADLLKRSTGIFENAKMFADHQTDKDAAARPEGSVKDWVATITGVKAESDGTIKATANVHDPIFKESLSNLKKAGNLSQMGVSIRAFGEAVKGKVEGKDCMVIESLIGCKSVDFVTFAGAGGQVEAMNESADPDDVYLIDLETLKEKRPDLVIELTKKKPITESIRRNNGAADNGNAEPVKESGDVVTPRQRELIAHMQESENISEAEAYMTVTGKPMPEKLPDGLTAGQVAEYKFARATGISESDALRLVKKTGGYNAEYYNTRF